MLNAAGTNVFRAAKPVSIPAWLDALAREASDRVAAVRHQVARPHRAFVHIFARSPVASEAIFANAVVAANCVLAKCISTAGIVSCVATLVSVRAVESIALVAIYAVGWAT